MPLLPRSMTMGVQEFQALQTCGTTMHRSRAKIRLNIFMTTILGIDERNEKESGLTAAVGVILCRPVHLKVDGAAIAHGAVAGLEADAPRTDAVATFCRERRPSVVAAEQRVAGDLGPSRKIAE